MIIGLDLSNLTFDINTLKNENSHTSYKYGHSKNEHCRQFERFGKFMYLRYDKK